MSAIATLGAETTEADLRYTGPGREILSIWHHSRVLLSPTQ
jgi:hypothetical protein